MTVNALFAAILLLNLKNIKNCAIINNYKYYLIMVFL